MNKHLPTFRDVMQRLSARKVETRISLQRHRLVPLFCLLVLGACEARQQPAPEPLASATAVARPATGAAPAKLAESRIWMIAGERCFNISLSDNATGHAFARMLPLTLDMADLNGNEKHVDLPKALPANATRAGMIRNGDLMLYGSKTLVVFYETFNSPYSYSRIGRVASPAGLAQALGRHGARVRFLDTNDCPSD